jgi:hypothetical protein
MDLVDEYRRNARECERMAERAGNPADTASWLRLAASWLGMIRSDARRLFENENRDNGNGPAWPKPSKEDSSASH